MYRGLQSRTCVGSTLGPTQTAFPLLVGTLLVVIAGCGRTDVAGNAKSMPDRSDRASRVLAEGDYAADSAASDSGGAAANGAIGGYGAAAKSEMADAVSSLATSPAPSSLRGDGEADPAAAETASAPPPRSPADEASEKTADESIAEPASDDSGRPGRRKRQIQSGLLTAGSFDDIARTDAFNDFLSRSLQSDPGETFPRLPVQQRAIIHVVNGQGEPIGDAQVSIRPTADSSSNAQATLRTSSDGRALFLPAADGLAGTDAFQVAVEIPGGDSSEPQAFQIDQPTWTVTIDDAAHRAPVHLDLALVIDTTGSMGDELDYLQVEIDSIVASVNRMFPNVDQRYALILYRDQGDEYVTRTFDFDGSLEKFRSKLSQQSAGGGGDYPEAVHVAMEQAAELSWRGDDAARVMFLVGDAPPHDEDARRAIDAALKLRDRRVRLFPVAGSGVAWQAEFVFRGSAFLTMGQYLFLTDHSGVGLPHATPHVPEYQVERLDRLMIRMIASELAGKRLVPDEVIAIERGDDVSYESPETSFSSDANQPDATSAPEQSDTPETQTPAPTEPSPDPNPNADPSASPDDAETPGAADAGSSSTWRWIALVALVTGVFLVDAISDRRTAHA